MFRLSHLRFPASFSPQNSSTKISKSACSNGFISRNLSVKSEPYTPIAIVVTVEIEPSHVEEFLKVIEEGLYRCVSIYSDLYRRIDAVGSRKEPNCLRFDVLRSQTNPCLFYFYEVYRDAAAIEYHRNTPHFNLWKKFKVSLVSVRDLLFAFSGNPGDYQVTDYGQS